MGTFVLVHGAWHGAWCWQRLEAELAERGHHTVSMNLPVGDGDATFLDYRDAVLVAWPDADVDVIVGHSLGAMVLPLVVADRPVGTSVYLCPVVPNVQGMPWDDAPEMGAPGAYVTVNHDDGSVTFDSLDEAIATFYGDCDADDAAWAFARLQPQNSTSLWNRPYPVSGLAPGRRVVIGGRHDCAITPQFLRAVSELRLEVGPLMIAADHSPFLSATATLTEILCDIAEEVVAEL